MHTRYLTLALLAALTAPLLSAPAPPPGLPAMGKDNPVHINADRMVYEAPRKLMHLEGHVHFDMKDTTLTTSSAEFNTETQVGTLTGGVKVTQPGSTISSDKMLIFYARRRAVLSGNVKLVTTQAHPGGPPAAQASATPTVMRCREMEYFWEKHEGNAVGDVHVEQGDRQATADNAHYDETAKRVTLHGHVQFTQGGGNWLRAPVAYLDMQNQTFIAEGGVSAQLILNQPAPTSSGSPGGTGPATGPPTKVVVPPVAPQLQPVVPQDVPPDMSTTTPPPPPTASPSTTP